ncbi:hypothetical protein P4J05_04050 [Bacillus anthracis]|nr:hypothetical protein [Bacillus anthracis]MEB9454205.1 hypothetical protein [Bacillus anthracis]
MDYCDDLEIILATTEKDAALKEFISCSIFSLQVWEKGEVLIEMINSEGEYFADGGLERYPEKGQQLFNEIVEQLQQRIL